MKNTQSPAQKTAVTPELVEKVTERVYRLFLQEAHLEKERARLHGRPWPKRP